MEFTRSLKEWLRREMDMLLANIRPYMTSNPGYGSLPGLRAQKKGLEKF
jgi:hypothetical protein